MCICLFFFFKQKTAYEMRISDWSSDVCSSDLLQGQRLALEPALHLGPGFGVVVVDASLGHVTDTATVAVQALRQFHVLQAGDLLIEPVLRPGARSEEHSLKYSH